MFDNFLILLALYFGTALDVAPFGGIISMFKRALYLVLPILGLLIFTTLKIYVAVYVPRVVDGDTFIVRYGTATDKVRVIGIDAPESVHPNRAVEFFGPEASQELKRLIKDRWVILTFDVTLRDRYKRLLASVQADGKSVGAHMVANGYARAYARYQFKSYLEIIGYQRYSSFMKLGLWQQAQPPAEDSP